MVESVTNDTLAPRAVPAISADGSKPDAVFLQTPAQQGEATEAVKTEPAADPKVEAKPERKPDETPPWMKREVTKARNAERAAREDAIRYQAELKVLKEQREERKVEDDPKPVRSKYSDPDKYESDLVEWSARQGAKTVKSEMEKQNAQRDKDEAERKQRDYVTGIQQKWQDAREKFAAENPDYEEVAEADDLQISQALGVALLEANDETPGEGPKLAYYLGQNPDEAARLSKMSPARAAMELGRIAARFDAPAKPAPNPNPTPKDKRAPAPINPVGVRANATTDRNDPRSYDMEARLRQVRSNKQPFFPSQAAPPGRSN